MGLRYREDDLHVEHGFELRYREQLWEIMVPIDSGEVDEGTIASAVEDFHVRHHNRYAYSEPETPCELVSLSVRATVHRPLPEIDWELGASSQWRRLETRELRLGADEAVEVDVFEGSAAPVGVPLVGPALVREPLCTVVVAPGWTAALESHGAIRSAQAAVKARCHPGAAPMKGAASWDQNRRVDRTARRNR